MKLDLRHLPLEEGEENIGDFVYHFPPSFFFLYSKSVGLWEFRYTQRFIISPVSILFNLFESL